MITILTTIMSTVMNKPVKHFFLFSFTVSFLFLGSVNATLPSKYGPVKAGQTLWGIAYKTRPKGITRLEMMDALHKLNPSSFEKGNINLLKKGTMLILPTSKEMVSKLLAGDKIEIATETEEDTSKDLETLRSELASVKAELAKTKQALAGLKEQSEVLRQNEQSASSNNEAAEKLAVVSAELVKSKELIKTLVEKNKVLQTQSLDPKLLEETKQQLSSTNKELEQLKIQNQLLREQVANADITDQERKDNNHKFSETIAALNADIGQLRTRIKDLERIVKLKDKHIEEQQKSLDHATVVIKEQAEVNKKMYARLNALEKADKEKKQQDQTAVAASDNSNTPPSSGSGSGSGSGNNPVVVNFADKPGTSSTSLAVSETMKHVSPRFWLMLTLAGLLFVLALLWRMVSGKDEIDSEVAA